MIRSYVILALGSLATACAANVNTRNSPNGATENSLMQADRDFAVAARWRTMAGHHGHRLSESAGRMLAVISRCKNPVPFRVRGWLLVAHPSYKLDQ